MGTNQGNTQSTSYYVLQLNAKNMVSKPLTLHSESGKYFPASTFRVIDIGFSIANGTLSKW